MNQSHRAMIGDVGLTQEFETKYLNPECKIFPEQGDIMRYKLQQQCAKYRACIVDRVHS